MKKKIFALLAVVAITFPFAVSAATFGNGDQYTLRKGDTAVGNLYVAAGDVVVSGNVDGDLMVGGGNILVTGDVDDDLIAGGGNISILGKVNDDIRLVGGSLTVGNIVKGDVVATGGSIRILPEAIVEGDLIVAGGSIIIDGVVNGKLHVAGGDIQINGSVLGGVEAKISNSLKINDRAIVSGDINYTSHKEAVISDGASVGGEIVFNQIKRASAKKGARMFIPVIIGTYLFVKLLALLFAGILAVVFLKKFSEGLGSEVVGNFGSAALIGFATLVVFPILSIILMATVLGIFVGIIGFAVYALLLILAKIFAGIMLGAILSKLIKGKMIVNWQWAVLGIILFAALKFIPFIGWAIVFIIYIATLGSIANSMYHQVWLKRK
jgi:cytoskeletal protein CcmA (bactofilin family)